MVKGSREAGDTVETFKYVDVRRRVILERQEWELTEIEQCNGMCFIKESDIILLKERNKREMCK